MSDDYLRAQMEAAAGRAGILKAHEFTFPDLDPDPLLIDPLRAFGTDDEPWPVPGPDPVAETLSWYVVAVVALAMWLGLALVAMAIVRRR